MVGDHTDTVGVVTGHSLNRRPRDACRTGTAGTAGGPRACRTGIAGASRPLRGPPPGRGVTSCCGTLKERLCWTGDTIAETTRKRRRGVSASAVRALQPRSGWIEIASGRRTFIKEGRRDVAHWPLWTDDLSVGLEALNQEVFHIVDHGPGKSTGGKPTDTHTMSAAEEMIDRSGIFCDECSTQQAPAFGQVLTWSGHFEVVNIDDQEEF